MGLAAAPVLARFPPVQAQTGLVLLDAPLRVLPTIQGAGFVTGMRILGLRDIGRGSAMAMGRLVRGDDSLLEMPLNAAGGYVIWTPLGVMGGFVFTPEQPIGLDVSEDAALEVAYVHLDGRPGFCAIRRGLVSDGRLLL